MKDLVLIAVAILSLIIAHPADAQQPKKVPRIGYLSAVDRATDSPRAEGIRRALREVGYIEGQNIAFEYRYAEGNRGRQPELAAELVHLKVDVIVVAGGDPWIRAAKNATKTIPIVMTGSGSDPVNAGLVESLARPGAMSPALQPFLQNSAGNGWSCSKKPFPNLPVSQFSMIRSLRAVRVK